jgi:hypothetical protein
MQRWTLSAAPLCSNCAAYNCYPHCQEDYFAKVCTMVGRVNGTSHDAASGDDYKHMGPVHQVDQRVEQEPQAVHLAKSS